MRISARRMHHFLGVAGCAVAAVAGLCSAADAVGEQRSWRLDFEAYVPGQAPSEWTPLWGDQGDDLITVTSDYASCGKRAVLFEHPDGDGSSGQWGASTSFPAFPETGGALQWDFLYIGAGGDARFSFEVRNRASKSVGRLSVGYQHVSFDATERSRKTAVRPGVWYRVQMAADCREGSAGRKVHLRLRELASDAWLIEETLADKDAGPLESARSICLCFLRTPGPYRVYVDNVMTIPIAGKPPSTGKVE